MSIVVSDSSPLICLVSLNQARLLHQLFGQVLVPPAVASEVAYPHRSAPGISVQTIAGIEIRGATDASFIAQIPTTLDAGEREALALALEVKADYLLIDELAGRRIAEVLKIRVTGTCGILALAKQQGLIPAMKPLLDRLRTDQNFFISNALYEDVLRSVGELSK